MQLLHSRKVWGWIIHLDWPPDGDSAVTMRFTFEEGSFKPGDVIETGAGFVVQVVKQKAEHPREWMGSILWSPYEGWEGGRRPWHFGQHHSYRRVLPEELTALRFQTSR